MDRHERRGKLSHENDDHSLFELGEVMVSPPARMFLGQQHFPLQGLLDAHRTGEWRADAARELANDMAIATGRGRIVSTWQVGMGTIQITTRLAAVRETLVTVLPKK